MGGSAFGVLVGGLGLTKGVIHVSASLSNCPTIPFNTSADRKKERKEGRKEEGKEGRRKEKKGG